jgi:hypothetical protein
MEAIYYTPTEMYWYISMGLVLTRLLLRVLIPFTFIPYWNHFPTIMSFSSQSNNFNSSNDSITESPCNTPSTSRSLASSSSSDDVSITDPIHLSYEPEIIKGKSGERVWHVNTSKYCVDFCKTQLKVCYFVSKLNVEWISKLPVRFSDQEIISILGGYPWSDRS